MSNQVYQNSEQKFYPAVGASLFPSLQMSNIPPLSDFIVLYDGSSAIFPKMATAANGIITFNSFGSFSICAVITMQVIPNPSTQDMDFLAYIFLNKPNITVSRIQTRIVAKGNDPGSLDRTITLTYVGYFDRGDTVEVHLRNTLDSGAEGIAVDKQNTYLVINQIY